MERDEDLRCFCGVEIEPVDLLLEIEGAFVDSALDGVFAFALRSGVWIDAALPLISVVLRLRAVEGLVVLGRNSDSRIPG